MEKIKIFRGFYPILIISSILVLVIVGFLSLFNLRYRISFQEGLTKEHIQKTIFSLQKTIAPTIEQGDAIRKSAEYYLTNPETQAENLYFKYLNDSDIEDFQAYDMDSLPQQYQNYIGNVTGLGSIETISQNEIDQINMAVYVSPLLSSLKNSQESIALSYYLSPEVCLLYPYPKSSDFRLSPEVATHIPKTNGVVYPEQNPERNHAWTDIYADDVGNGLMVTGLFPVYKNDTFLGSLGFDFTLNNLNQIISNSQLNIGEDFIINNHNQILAHPELVSSQDTAIKSISSLNIEKKYIDDIANFQELEEATFHYLENYILYYEKIPLTPWYSIYFVNKTTFYFTAFKDSAINLLIVFLSLIAVLLVTALFTRKKFIAPAALLVKHIQAENSEDAKKNTYINKVPSEWESWFVIVSDTFKKNRDMVGALKESNELLERKVEERTAEITTQNEELIQQQEEILTQRDAIEQKNRDLTSASDLINKSISAAQIIQNAMLPSTKLLQSSFKEYFVFNKPRDIVSGDFYWIGKVEDKIILVVADCTGHGIPGAFMTLIGITMLNRIVNLNNIIEPNNILNALHEGIQSLLKQEETDTNVGMDAAVIVLKENEKNTDITYGGAKVPLIYYNSSDSSINEIKPVRKSIGGYQNNSKEFINQTLTLSKESVIYLGSDGLADQNNQKRKSLGRSALINHFSTINELSLDEQEQSLNTLLQQQMQGTVQRDDILWVGIKV